MLKDILLMISTDKITEIFCSIDDFCLVFEPALRKRQVSTVDRADKVSHLRRIKVSIAK